MTSLIYILFFYSFFVVPNQLFANPTVNPQNQNSENIYIHLDKPFYSKTDNIWFKAYVTNSENNKPTKSSNILYAELIDSRNEIIERLTLPMENGQTWSGFTLSPEFPEGTYRIRAYTNLSKNKGDGNLYEKLITIINNSRGTVLATANIIKSSQKNTNVAELTFSDLTGDAYKNAAINYELYSNDFSTTKGKGKTDILGKIELDYSEKIVGVLTNITLPNGQKINRFIDLDKPLDADFQFFPEGGRLVENLTSKIGVKSVGPDGYGLNAFGKIVDEKNQQVAKFEINHLGIGSFEFKPLPSKNYNALIKFSDGTEKMLTLPKALKEGYVISITPEMDSFLTVNIQKSNLEKNKNITLTIQKDGKEYFRKEITSAQTFEKINTSNIPNGTALITILSNELPILERLVFIKNATTNNELKISKLKQEYKNKDDIEINLSFPKGIATYFSVSVTPIEVNVDSVENESNIFTELLLTNEIIGLVEQPNYYFLRSDQKTTNDLDNLMLTQGWRSIETKKTIPNSTKFIAEQSLSISGTITLKDKPLENRKITLTMPSEGFLTYSTESDTLGKFKFSGVDFEGKTSVYINSEGVKSKDIKVVLDEKYWPKIGFPKYVTQKKSNTSLFNSDTFKNDDSFKNDNNSIKEVVIETSAAAAKAPNSSNLNGAGNADYILTSKEIEKIFDFRGVFNLIPFLIFKNDNLYSNRTVKGFDGRAQPVLIILNGMRLGEVKDLFGMINIREIESVEYLIKPSYTAVYSAGGGVLIITTKKGTSKPDAITQKSISSKPIEVTGYSIYKEFYIPVFQINSIRKSYSTVFWLPHLKGSNEGISIFSFTHQSGPGKYNITIQGINDSGMLFNKQVNYIVK